MGETRETIRKKAFEELFVYMSWVAKNYPRVHEEYMCTCHKCGKKFVHAIDSVTKKKSEYVWKPNCDCIDENLRLGVG